jgi:hypothetical protein
MKRILNFSLTHQEKVSILSTSAQKFEIGALKTTLSFHQVEDELFKLFFSCIIAGSLICEPRISFVQIDSISLHKELFESYRHVSSSQCS